jgi:hypothetical protein
MQVVDIIDLGDPTTAAKELQVGCKRWGGNAIARKSLIDATSCLPLDWQAKVKSPTSPALNKSFQLQTFAALDRVCWW